MTAKEMFEKLGYECFINKELEEIDYTKKDNKEFIVFVHYRFDNSYVFYKQTDYEPGDITMEELQAINKQVEELGWK